MVSLRLGFVTAAVLASSLLVSAVPVPTWPPHNGPAAHRVEEGDVYRAEPVNFHPQHPGNSAGGGAILHPVVAIGRTSPGGRVPAVAMSHNHPPHMQNDVRPASDYDRYTRHQGQGQFQPGTQAAIGNPVRVHHTDLRPPNGGLPHQLHYEDTRRLVEDTYHSSGYHSTNQPHAHPSTQQQIQGAPWRSSQHGHAHQQQPANAYAGYGTQHHAASASPYAGYGQHPQQQHSGAYAPAHQHQQPAVYPPGHPYAGYAIPPGQPGHSGYSGHSGHSGYSGHSGHSGNSGR